MSLGQMGLVRYQLLRDYFVEVINLLTGELLHSFGGVSSVGFMAVDMSGATLSVLTLGPDMLSYGMRLLGRKCGP
jgi:hypothetical protein